jgi:hypothetical protein
MLQKQSFPLPFQPKVLRHAAQHLTSKLALKGPNSSELPEGIAGVIPMIFRFFWLGQNG